MTIYTFLELTCDDCGFSFHGAERPRELRREAKKLGWTWDDHKIDRCPDCQTKPFTLDEETHDEAH